jgi:hypothetical protein
LREGEGIDQGLNVILLEVPPLPINPVAGKGLQHGSLDIRPPRTVIKKKDGLMDEFAPHG